PPPSGGGHPPPPAGAQRELERVVSHVVPGHLLPQEVFRHAAEGQTLAEKAEEERLLIRGRMSRVATQECVIAEHARTEAVQRAEQRNVCELVRGDEVDRKAGL